MRGDTVSGDLRLWIHIGLPKTGTSAIQSVFQAAAPSLRTSGVDYPNTGELGGGHARLAWPLLTAQRRGQPDVLETLTPEETHQLWLDLAREVRHRGCRQAFVSSEYFSEAEPAALAELAGLVSSDIRILVYLRRQDELIESGYNQDVKAGIVTARFEMPGYSPIYDYRRMLQSWGDAFGHENLVARTYDSALIKRGAVADVAHTIGIDLDVLPDPDITANLALHPALVEFQRIANSVGVADPSLASLVQARIGALRDGGVRQFLSSAERTRILELYAESNAAVARDYFDRPDGILFDVPQSGEHGAPPEVSSETLVAALMLTWSDLSDQVAALRSEVDELRRQVQPDHGGRSGR